MVSENKEYFVFFHWSLEVILVTVGVTILFLVLLIPMLKSEAPSQILKYSLASLLVAPIVSGLFISPIFIRINNEKIQIKKPITSIEIPIAHIVSVKKINIGEISNAIRTFGSGGFFGYVGYFKNDKYGKFLMYATERKNLVLIQTHDKSYVVSCRNPDILIKNEKIIDLDKK